jgi:hypothetical protein
MNFLTNSLSSNINILLAIIARTTTSKIMNNTFIDNFIFTFNEDKVKNMKRGATLAIEKVALVSSIRDINVNPVK